jgi:hypothetical protein
MKATWTAAGALATLGLLAIPPEATAGVRGAIEIRLGSGYRDGRDYRDPRGYRQRDGFRLGYDRGYDEGARRGYQDGRRGRRHDYARHRDYRRADRGYKGWMGPRRNYAAGFRRGYEAGYSRAYASARPGYRDHARRRY